MTGDDEGIAIIERLCDDPTMWGTHGCPPDYKLERLVAEFRAYGEQCRRAGAEAMRESAAKTAGDCVMDRRESQLAMLAVRALPLPSAAEAVSPAVIGNPMPGPMGQAMAEETERLDALRRPSEAASPAAGWRETIIAVMAQADSDLASAHAEICRLQNLDPKTHNWPEWSPQANSLRWHAKIRNDLGLDSPSEEARAG